MVASDVLGLRGWQQAFVLVDTQPQGSSQNPATFAAERPLPQSVRGWILTLPICPKPKYSPTEQMVRPRRRPQNPQSPAFLSKEQGERGLLKNATQQAKTQNPEPPAQE